MHKVCIPPMEVNKLTVTDSQEKANAISKQFHLSILRRMSLDHKT